MPYIIETRMAAEPPNQDVAVRAAVLSRIAVATLDEARREGRRIMANAGEWSTADIDELPESGGTVGPLPDGTVIEVRQAGYVEIAAAVDNKPATWTSEQSILAAFNAA
jgi:hypothetical protein